jgi:hypothetical protein
MPPASNNNRMTMMRMMKMMIIIIKITIQYKTITIQNINNKRNVKTKMISLIIVATGTISKSLRHYLSNIPGNHEKKNILGNAHIRP